MVLKIFIDLVIAYTATVDFLWHFSSQAKDLWDCYGPWPGRHHPGFVVLFVTRCWESSLKIPSGYKDYSSDDDVFLVKQWSFNRCHYWKKNTFKIPERFSCWNSSRCSMCICVWTFHQWSCAIRPGTLLTKSCQEDQTLPSTHGKCSQRALKQSDQIITDTSYQQCPALKMLHKLFYTLTPYSSDTPWSHPGILVHKGSLW